MYDAVILAGGTSPWLQKTAGTSYRAWAPLLGKPMAFYISDALLSSGVIERVLLAGPDVPVPCALPAHVEFLTAGDTLMATVSKALASVNSNRPVIFVTDDIPMLSAAAVADFVHEASQLQVDVCYSIVPKEAVEKTFPHAHRTYVRLRDGCFTGGNIFWVEPKVVPHLWMAAEDVFAKRKDIFGLCKWLGWSFVWRYLCGRLALQDVIARASAIFAVKGYAVVTSYAEIGMDVDKPEDWLMSEKYLQSRVKGAEKRHGKN